MNKEYQFYLVDDHKGNKVLFVTKGRRISYEDLVGKNVSRIDDPAFEPFAKQLRNIIDKTTTKNIKGGDNRGNN